MESRSDGTPANHKKQSEPRAEREGARGDCYTLMPRPPVCGLTPYAVAGCRPLLSSGLHYLLFVSRGCARNAGLPLPLLYRPRGTQVPRSCRPQTTLQIPLFRSDRLYLIPCGPTRLRQAQGKDRTTEAGYPR